MRRKNFLLVFSAAFFIALLAVATAPTTAAPTNNWGVEADTTLTYKMEETYGDHSSVAEYEVTVVTVKDTTTGGDDLDDLLFTWQVTYDGIEPEAGDGRIPGTVAYDYWDIIGPDYPFILPIDDQGPAVQGLDWADAKTDIENLEDPPYDYDKATVTEDGDKFKVEIETHGEVLHWGDFEETATIEWDTSKGTLESYSYEIVYEDAGITETEEISKGSIDGGLVSPMILAGAALGLAVLALLIVLVKK